MKNRRNDWERLAELHHDVNEAEEMILTTSGWRLTDDTVSGGTMWIREIDGKHFVVDRKRALYIQHTIDVLGL